MESSDVQSHSLQNTVQNNSGLLGQELATKQKQLELQEIIEGGQTLKSNKMESRDVHTIAFSSKGKCNGHIGCPITFLADYCSAQFNIIGIGSDVPKTMEHIAYKEKGIICYEKNGIPIYTFPYTVSERKIGNSLRIFKEGKPCNTPYNRIIIQRKTI